MVEVRPPGLTEGYAVLVDLDKCIGCRACQVACKDWNGRAVERTKFTGALTSPGWLSADTWKVVFYYEGRAVKRVKTPAGEVSFEQVELAPLPYNCMHCANPPCARACPVGAIKVTREGAVVISKDECVGCGYCETACMFNVPKRSFTDGKIYKCTFCVDRIQNGMPPACVEVCPAGVYTFGPAGEIVKKALEERARGRYIYGLDLDGYVGGAARWIYVASDKKAFAIKQHFADKTPRVAQQVREVVKPLVIYGGAVLAIAVTAIGLAAWRRHRLEEKRAKA
jgi:formate dehydrogenase iron-sulfur subunit